MLLNNCNNTLQCAMLRFTSRFQAKNPGTFEEQRYCKITNKEFIIVCRLSFTFSGDLTQFDSRHCCKQLIFPKVCSRPSFIMKLVA